MTMTTTCTTTDTIYISPYEIRRPRGRPKKTESECVPKVQIPKPKPPALRGVGRPKREVPLTPDELRERRRKYKKIVNEIQKEYENFYQHCYSRRPEVKERKAEYKRATRLAEREAKKAAESH